MHIRSIISTLNPGRRLAALGAGFTLIALAFGAQFASADDNGYSRGEHIEPAYEGWRDNPDGTTTFFFGYMNENWEEEVDVPVGDENMFSPGAADRGQPTHFLPRRNRFTFEVIMPVGWADDQELVWTLTSNGKTRKAYASKLKDFTVDDQIIASETGSLSGGFSTPETRSNVGPTAVVQGDTVNGEHIRNVRVGEELTLVTHVTDDGIPKPRFTTEFFTKIPLALRMMRPPSRATVSKFNGLWHSWSVYRGEGEGTVHFSEPQTKVWEDTRPASNSPWGSLWVPPAVPEDGNYSATVTFDKPGTYVLWGRTDDGALYADNYVTVNVSP
ncbi:MAG: hypothetical protein JKY98_01525 [Gammaproteobacteria bacterium]|nr:hypothetical protein [Gammaproteobacteria bacterium]